LKDKRLVMVDYQLSPTSAMDRIKGYYEFDLTPQFPAIQDAIASVQQTDIPIVAHRTDLPLLSPDGSKLVYAYVEDNVTLKEGGLPYKAFAVFDFGTGQTTVFHMRPSEAIIKVLWNGDSKSLFYVTILFDDTGRPKQYS